MDSCIPLTHIKFWCPEMNLAVPFTYYNKKTIGHKVGSGQEPGSYIFFIDNELAEFQNDLTGLRMPCATARLCNIHEDKVVPFTNFAILDDGYVQVNLNVNGGYRIDKYRLEDMFFFGYAYDPKEDTD